jgi:hypothetical protein
VKNRREHRKKRLSRHPLFGTRHFRNVTATVANYVFFVITALPWSFQLG